MKRFLFISFLFLVTQLNFAQINAITDTGEQVVLYNDGTWKYVNEENSEPKEIPVNKEIFTKDKDASFLVKSNNLNVGIWINPKKWSFTKEGKNEDAEFSFQLKKEDLYAMLIAEKIQIPIETLKEIALENARNVSPDIKIVKEEYRNVNGIKVLMLQLQGTIKGINFTYYGYYYSNANGSMQLIAYTGGGLFENYKKDIELFLNGLVEL
jgi:hypothetical protein